MIFGAEEWNEASLNTNLIHKTKRCLSEASYLI